MPSKPPASLLLEWMTASAALTPTTEPVAIGVLWRDNGVLTYSTGIPPVVTDQPDDASVADGETATFSVAATNATSYQWQKQESGAGAWSNISGATSASYTTGVLTAAADSTDKYRCNVAGLGGSVTSDAATLTVARIPPTGSAIWLRAQDEAYSNGANVTQWSDRSGNARHFTIGSNYPTFVANANNGKAAIAFNGTNQGLNRSYTGSGTAYTIAGIVAQDDTTFKVWWQNGIAPYVGWNVNRTVQFYRGATLASNIKIPQTNWMPVVVRVSGTTAEIFLGTMKVASGTVTSGPLAVAGLCNLASYFFPGKLQEIVAYESALSDANLTILVNYLLEQAGKADTPRYVICDGDSLTQGVTPANPYPTYMQTALGSTYSVQNFGVSGQTIVYNATAAGSGYGYLNSDVATQVDPYLAARKIDGTKQIVIAWAGTNDVYYGRTGTEAHTDFAAYCAARQAAGAKVIAINMIDRRTDLGSWTKAYQNDFNALFASNAATYSDAHYDAAAVFVDNTNTTYYQSDKIHLTSAGNLIVSNALTPLVQSL